MDTPSSRLGARQTKNRRPATTGTAAKTKSTNLIKTKKMTDQIYQKVQAIIDSCTNEQHVQVATQTVKMVCFEPGVGLSAEQVNSLLHRLNDKIKSLQQELATYRNRVTQLEGKTIVYK